LEPSNVAPYVVLANMYAYVGKWNDVSRVRKMMKDRGIKKHPGCSWIYPHPLARNRASG
jgi:hypothetical protein